MKTVANLNKGESGLIKEVVASPVKSKLLDMGCIPGEEVVKQHQAPFDGPICISIGGYQLIIRKEEAEKIELV